MEYEQPSGFHLLLYRVISLGRVGPISATVGGHRGMAHPTISAKEDTDGKGEDVHEQAMMGRKSATL